MRTLWTAMLAVLGLTVPVGAQIGGEATWLWDVETEDGDDIVEPGETATVTLSIDMVPDVNFPDGPVLGFAATVFNTIGGEGAAHGEILGWQVLSGLDWSGEFTTTNGVDLFGTNPFQDPFIGPGFDESDPIAVFQFQWGTSNYYSSYSVSYSTESFATMNHPHEILVWEGEYFGDADYFEWSIAEAAISFEVVPSPSAMAIVASMGALWRHRRLRMC